MSNEIGKLANGTLELPPAPFVVDGNPGLKKGADNAAVIESAAIAALKAMIDKEADRLELLHGRLGASPAQRRKQLSDELAVRLKETHKDTWDLLPKDYQDAVLKLQEAVITGDLEQLGKLAKSLKPEVAEEMTELVERHLRAQGAKVHIKSADGQLLLYEDNAKHAVLMGKDGKASAVTIEANEPDGPPNILEGKRPFKSAQTLASEIADRSGKEIRASDKEASDDGGLKIRFERDPNAGDLKAIYLSVGDIKDEPLQEEYLKQIRERDKKKRLTDVQICELVVKLLSEPPEPTYLPPRIYPGFGVP